MGGFQIGLEEFFQEDFAKRDEDEEGDDEDEEGIYEMEQAGYPLLVLEDGVGHAVDDFFYEEEDIAVSEDVD